VESTQLTLEEYEIALKNADWWYMMSDDHRWYTKGRYECKKLYKISEQSEEYKDLWVIYCPHNEKWKG